MGYGSGSLFRRGKKGIFYCQAYVDGKQIGPFSTKTTDRKKAQLELDKLLGKRARGEISSRTINSAQGTLGEILDDYIRHAEDNLQDGTAYICKRTIEGHLRKPFGAMRAVNLTKEKLERYRKDRRAEGGADSTINRELSYFRAALRLASKKGLTLTIPWFPMVNEDGNARQGYKEEAEFLRFLDALDIDLRPFACTAYYGGLRRGELVKLLLEDIDIERRFIMVRFGKNKDSRTVPIFDGPMLQWLEWLWEHRQPSQVKAFVFSDGRPVTVRNFYDKWHAAAKASGIGYFIPHDSRRSNNRRLSREGVPQALRMKLHGWRTDEMDRRYGVVDVADADAVRILINARREAAETRENPPTTTAKTTTGQVKMERRKGATA